MKNRICEVLVIEKPIVQGPMTWLTNAEFVAAVSNAGGLGVFGPHAGLREALGTPELAAENLREQIRKARKLADKPLGVNVIVNGAMVRWTSP